MPNTAAAAAARLSVAPMMDWTDRHCRYLHRLLSCETLLYTEMVTAPALVRGGALHLLDYSPEEQPVALQLGGSDPAELAQAARLGAPGRTARFSEKNGLRHGFRSLIQVEISGDAQSARRYSRQQRYRPLHPSPRALVHSAPHPTPI